MNRGDNMRFCREADPGGIIMHVPMPHLFFLKGKSHLPRSVQQESSGAKVAAQRSSLQFIRCDIKNTIRIFISVVIPEGHRTKGAFPVGAFQSVPVNIAPRVGEFQVPVIMFGILPVLAKLYMEAVVQKACGGDGESLRHGKAPVSGQGHEGLVICRANGFAVVVHIRPYMAATEFCGRLGGQAVPVRPKNRLGDGLCQ